MISTPLITVVLPTFNGERYLAESIESVLGQTHTHLELIIVDDCSTDSTPDIVQRYAEQDRRVRVHRNATNQRLPRSLNAGFALSQGEYLTWTSDDNRYRPEALSEMLSALQRHQEASIVYAEMDWIDDAGDVFRTSKREPPDVMVLRNPVGACFLYRRCVMETIGEYDDSMRLAEDYDFWLRASAQHKFQLLEQTLYFYRWHDASLSCSNRNEVLRSASDRAVEKALPRLGWVDAQRRSIAYLGIARRSWSRRELFRCMSALTNAVRANWRFAIRDVVGVVHRKCNRA